MLLQFGAHKMTFQYNLQVSAFAILIHNRIHTYIYVFILVYTIYRYLYIATPSYSVSIMAVALGLVLLVSKVFDKEQPVSVHLLIRSIGGNLLCVERYGRLVVTTFCIFHGIFMLQSIGFRFRRKWERKVRSSWGNVCEKAFLYKKMQQ